MSTSPGMLALAGHNPIWDTRRSSLTMDIPLLYEPADGNAIAESVANTMIGGGWIDGGPGPGTWPWIYAGPPPTSQELALYNLPPGSTDWIYHTAGRILYNAAGKKVWIRAVAMLAPAGFESMAVAMFRVFGAANSYCDSNGLLPTNPVVFGTAGSGKITIAANTCSVAIVTQTGRNPMWLGSPVYGRDTFGNLLIDGSMLLEQNAALNPWTGTSTFWGSSIEAGGTMNPGGNMLSGYFVCGWMGIRYDGYSQASGDEAWGLVTADGLPLYMAPGIQVTQGITSTVGVKYFMLDGVFLTVAGAFGSIQTFDGHDCMCLTSCPGSADGQGAMAQSVWVAID